MEPIKTRGRDIAYHFRINGPHSEFKEGDVVAFVEGPDKRTRIELLTTDNYGKAKMAGVISRSNFISGNLPKESCEGLLRLTYSFRYLAFFLPYISIYSIEKKTDSRN